VAPGDGEIFFICVAFVAEGPDGRVYLIHLKIDTARDRQATGVAGSVA